MEISVNDRTDGQKTTGGASRVKQFNWSSQTQVFAKREGEKQKFPQCSV